jgi:hypothetical protein
MLAGIGPEARVEQLSCDRDLDVLLAGPTTYRKRLHVAATDFVAGETPETSSGAGHAGAPFGGPTPTRVARLDAK